MKTLLWEWCLESYENMDLWIMVYLIRRDTRGAVVVRSPVLRHLDHG